ncbi:MAG: erythromycin esterase family protein [Bacteroidia bacterium]
MKFIATCLVLIICNVCFPQFESILEHTFSVKSISPDDDDFSDLEILKERIGNASVVMLGEQTHGDGATFEAKTRLVKFLHQEMGFDILAFEGEMYGLMKTDEAIKNGGNHYSAFNKSVYSIWSDSQEFVPLMDYVKKVANTDFPLQLKGFDVQSGSDYMSEFFMNDLKRFLSENNIQFDETFFIPIEIFIKELSGGDFKNYTSSDSLNFVNTCTTLVEKINRLPKSKIDEKIILWSRLLSNLIVEHQLEMDYINNVPEIVQNSRDKAMAENLLFLKRLYPNRKIICWGASFHFAKSWNTIETNDTISKNYLDKISIDQSSPDYDIKEMSQAVVMGEYVAKELKEDVYSIAFSSYSGIYNYGKNKPVYEAPDGSIEKHLFNEGHYYAFVDLSRLKDIEKFYASPEGYIPFKANWEKMFDGIFFIKEMYPSTAIKRTDLDFEETKIENIQTTFSTNKFKGVLIDNKTKEPIAYAYVGLKNNSIATASNEDGYFELKISKELKTDTIQIQTIGYAKKCSV